MQTFLWVQKVMMVKATIKKKKGSATCIINQQMHFCLCKKHLSGEEVQVVRIMIYFTLEKWAELINKALSPDLKQTKTGKH
jgi:hypothetical protein